MYQIVEALAGRTRRHRGRRLMGYFLGIVFLVGSYAALVPAVLFVAIYVVLAASGNDVSLDNTEGSSVAVIVGSIVVSILLLKIGVKLIRGRRHLVLFLRKFGFTNATQALSLAVGDGVGRRWRLITLDDHDVAPMGVGGRSRWTVRLMRLLFVIATVAAGIAAAKALSPDAYNRMVEDARAQAEANGESQFSASIGAIIGSVVLLMFWSFVIGLVATGVVLLSSVSRSSRKAEESKAVVVRRPEDIEHVARDLRRRTKKVLAPRIVVARVSDAVWQAFVRRMAAASDVVLVDISSPTTNLVWEVQQLVDAGTRWLPVGDADRLAGLTTDPSTAAVELRRLLDNRSVIGYRHTSLPAFSEGLRHSLEVVVA